MKSITQEKKRRRGGEMRGKEETQEGEKKVRRGR